MDTTVPNVTGKDLADAKAKLEARGFGYKIVGDGDTVTDQTPVGGAVIPGKSVVILYAGAEKSTDQCTVPQLVGKSPSEANAAATNAGLLIRFSGATDSGSGSVRVLRQSLAAGSKADPGTVIDVQLSDGSGPALATVTTDAEGIAHFRDLTPGPYELWARRDAAVSPLVRIANIADKSRIIMMLDVDRLLNKREVADLKKAA